MKLLLTWKLHHYWLASIVWKFLFMLLEEKSIQQSHQAVSPADYKTWSLVPQWHKCHARNQPLSDCTSSPLDKVELMPGTVTQSPNPQLARSQALRENLILLFCQMDIIFKLPPPVSSQCTSQPSSKKLPFAVDGDMCRGPQLFNGQRIRDCGTSVSYSVPLRLKESSQKRRKKAPKSQRQ